MQLDVLRERFVAAAAAMGASGGAAWVFDELVERYGEPHRRYHTLEHVDACLRWLDAFADLAERPEEVELALWFHDAVYDPKSRSNEEDSAALARARLAALGVRPASIERICGFVEATRGHAPAVGDTGLVLDLDLSIFASSEEGFQRFERQIREENGFVPAPLYRAARRKIVTQYLRREALYNHPAIRERWEAQARRNLAVQVRRLGGWPLRLARLFRGKPRASDDCQTW